MTKDTLWPLESHTKGKHAVLREYLKAWLPILSTYNARVLFIDGFAGPGVYEGGEEGSPLIAIRSLREHSAKEKIKEVFFFFIEADPRRAESLKTAVEALRAKGELPNNCSVYVETGRFDGSIHEVLQALEEQKAKMAPAFVMIDPFGVSDTPMNLIQRLLQNDRLEVYVSFMYEFLNRFKGTPEFEPHLDDLFGCTEWRKGLEIPDSDERKTFFFDLYESQLRASGAKYVVRFELFQNNRLKYAIFFGTKHRLGADRMKQAIWKVAPVGDFAFRGGRNAQLALGLPTVDYNPLRNAIHDFLLSRSPNWVSVDDVIQFVIEQTDYHSGQFKKNALRVLETQGRLEVDPASRKKAGTYPDGCRMRAKVP